MSFVHKLAILFFVLLFCAFGVLAGVVVMSSRYEAGFQAGKAAVVLATPTIPEPTIASPSATLAPTAGSRARTQQQLRLQATLAPTRAHVSPTLSR